MHCLNCCLHCLCSMVVSSSSITETIVFGCGMSSSAAADSKPFCCRLQQSLSSPFSCCTFSLPFVTVCGNSVFWYLLTLHNFHIGSLLCTWEAVTEKYKNLIVFEWRPNFATLDHFVSNNNFAINYRAVLGERG